VAELEKLVGEHPLRERLIGELMLALYRAGRQSEALAVYRTARDRLVEQLGLEPGPDLRESERRILVHDPTLTVRRRTTLGGRRRGVRRRASVAAVAGVALMVALAVARLSLGFGQAHPARATLDGSNGLVAVDPGSGRTVAASRVADAVAAVSSGAGSVWMASPGAGAITRLDPRSGKAIDRIPVGGEPASIVAGAGAIWAASSVGAAVDRIDPATGNLTQRIAIPGSNLDALAFGARHLWTTDPVRRTLFELDPTSGSLRRAVSLDLRPSDVTVGAGSVWVAGYDSGTVERIDPRSGAATGRVRVGDGPVALTVSGGSLWVANEIDATVVRVDPASLKVRSRIAVGSGPSALAAAPAGVWVADQYSRTVSRIDPRSDRVVQTVPIGGAPTSLTTSGHRVWVGVNAAPGDHRGGRLVITSTARVQSVDPAFYNGASTPQFIGLAYDGLVTFEHTDGSSGLRLVPDLATSIPSPAAGGRNYTFRIRPGIRYSDGRLVRADDFRRAIERLFRLRSPGAHFFAGLAGARRCTAHPASCDLSAGIVADDSGAVVTFHLTAPDPDFLFKLTESGFSAPIPPERMHGAAVPPGTGPYRIVSVTGAEIRFARNPFFHEWSHAAQPSGNPNAIVWRFADSTRAAVTAV
jgi:streptogramin lyase